MKTATTKMNQVKCLRCSNKTFTMSEPKDWIKSTVEYRDGTKIKFYICPICAAHIFKDKKSKANLEFLKSNSNRL